MKNHLTILQVVIAVGVLGFVISPYLFEVDGIEGIHLLLVCGPALLAYAWLEQKKQKIDQTYRTSNKLKFVGWLIAIPILFVFLMVILAGLLA